MPPDEVLEPLALGMTAHVFVFVLGALFGSFANVCIYRWPAGLSVVRPGSRCGSCETPVSWYDNIPIFSYLILRGQCRHCRVEFSARYMFVEAAMGMLFVGAYHFTLIAAYPLEPLSLRMLRFVILASFLFVLMVITFIDLDHLLILDLVTLPAIPLFYALGLLLPGQGYLEGIIGAVVGYGVPWLIGALYQLIRGRPGMGLGDSKFLAMVGALYGWQAVFAALFLGSLVGSVIMIPLSLFTDIGHRELPMDEVEDADEGEHADEGETADEAEHESDDETAERDDDARPLGEAVIPFGPFLAIGAGVYAFAEPWLQIRFVGM